jgi:hypothetical protein
LPENLWPILINTIKSIIYNQQLLFLPSPEVESMAQILAPKVLEYINSTNDQENVKNIDNVSYHIVGTLLVRTAGIGHLSLFVSLFVMEHLSYVKAFQAVGFTTEQTKIALGLIGARIEAPDSERGTLQCVVPYNGSNTVAL